MPFPPATRKALILAAQEAQAHGHTIIQPEHLLLGLLQDQAVINLLARIHADPNQIKRKLDAHLSTIPAEPAKHPKKNLPDQFAEETLIHLGGGAPNSDDALPHRILIAMVLSSKNGFALKTLKEEGVTKKEIQLATTPVRIGTESLKLYCRNLNQDAVSKTIQPVIGRDHDLEKIVKTLSRKNKSNPILIGDAGVGKTATVKGLVHQIVHQKVPANLKNAQVFALNISSLSGDIEGRLKSVIRDIAADDNAILFIDDIHNLHISGLQILKPAIEAGQIRCIATTNYKDFRNSIEPHPSLTRLFLKHDLSEPGIDDTFKIVKKSIGQYESHHGVHYRSDAILTAVKLGNRYIQNKKMPDKVFDILDQSGADKNFHSKSSRTITAQDIERVVSDMTNIPLSALNQDEQEKMELLEADLKSAVMDQDEAAKILASAIRRARAGLNDPTKPIGSFLFQGPTGVGKTEITKQLGVTLGMKVLRFDMSEYMEKHSVSRLIGAPPGYVGFDQGGLLTEAAEKSPYSIILLDEIEKAHPDIFNILLQVMDHGKLTDNNGKPVNFRNTIIVMTTNAGSSEQLTKSIGFGATSNNDNGQQNIQDSIKKLFSPEFRNRLDAIVPFKHLEKPTVLKIADKFLTQLSGRLQERKISIEWTEEARNWLVDKGYNRNFGARPMSRLIQESVANPLADEILGGKLINGGHVSVTFNKAAEGSPTQSTLAFVYEPASAEKKSARKKPLEAKIA